MKTKKIKNIDSKVNPFNSITQKADYDRYESYMSFINTLESDNDDWDDELAIEWLKDDDAVIYQTDIISDRINERYEKGNKLIRFNQAAFNGFAFTADRLDRDDYMSISKIIVRACIKSMIKNSGDKYIMALASGEKPHDMADLFSVAYESLLGMLDKYRKTEWVLSSFDKVKYVDLSYTIGRRVRRQNHIAWNHVMNESDYKTVEKSIYEWVRSDVYAYIQNQRGIRINVPERYKALVKNPKTGKLERVEKVRNNSVYVPFYSIDDMTDGMYYTMKATSFNTDDNGKTENPYMATLYKELKSGKIVTKKQLKYLIGYFNGDSYRTIGNENGCHESTVRESVKSGLKKIEKWLIGHGYNVAIENGKVTFKTWE